MASSLNDHVTAEIRAELGRQRKRQRVLAEPLGFSEAQVSQRLSGRVFLNLRELEIIADELGQPVTHFLPQVDREAA